MKISENERGKEKFPCFFSRFAFLQSQGTGLEGRTGGEEERKSECVPGKIPPRGGVREERRKTEKDFEEEALSR